ncbi:hypothetical protein CJ030_MR4G010949 [Morella rubra]|uniref:Uncharacterized protein n=1 Tax=Morella rubra TaxID=262757 RepID=A0A6A1VV89_9ROSI|nr:hypothetical protein CJ030_MR4G010957 [Morella rubra]KAB1215837.1 hypothetical protein CJ030_MR4G010949 [Morella rubra]
MANRAKRQRAVAPCPSSPPPVFNDVQQHHVDGEAVGAATSNSGRRGRTRGLALDKVQATQLNKLSVSIPYNCAADVECKEYVRVCILDDFNLDYNREEDLQTVNMIMAKSYRQFKGRLHEHYKKKGGGNKEVAIRHPHPDMDEDTWAKLCDMFADPKYEEKCKVNTENRKGLTIFHTAGTRTFARYRKVLRLGQLNCMLHPTREKWDWLSDVAKDNHEKMRELQEQAISDGRSYNDIDILHQVLGPKPGYVRGLGRAVKPPRSSGSHPLV